EIVPAGIKSRLRGLQTHRAKIETAGPGSRVAANLVGVNTSQLERGDVVTRPGWLVPTRLVTVKLSLISYLPRPLRHGATVSFHTGAAETMARVRLLEADELRPGAATWAQLALDRPVATIKGDRYIVRSPMETLGGGGIVDAQARRLRRFRPEVIQNLRAQEEGSEEDIILALLEARQPLEPAALAARGNLPADKAGRLIEELVRRGRVVAVGEGDSRLLFTSAGWERLGEKAAAALAEYHRRFPARGGMPRIELSGRLKLGGRAGAAITNLVKTGVLVEEGSILRLPDHSVKLTPGQQANIDAFLKSLEQSPYAPPGELIPEADLLNMLIGQGRVVKVSDNIAFSAAAYREMADRVTAHIREKGKVSLGEVRDMFGTSRKYAQALLEYLDREKVTRRVGDDRLLY
ncbi:MAG TPA: SelB C-terminal domain-containing protein, partial [Dehalococcoidales bacterium]|nr:SelB C-terminal domain-containing protein [Dehalococcoidales bacterium]